MILGYVVLGLALLIPLLLGIGFRVATSHIFFGLMAGELLGRYFGHTLEKLLNIPKPYAGLGEVIFIVATIAITAYIMRGHLSRKRMVIHVVPLLVTGIISAAFLLPVLPVVLQEAVQTVEFGSTLLSLNKAIVGTMIVLQIVWLWFMHGSRARKRGRHVE